MVAEWCPVVEVQWIEGERIIAVVVVFVVEVTGVAASENELSGNVDGSCAASFFDWIRGEDSGVFGASAFEFRE